MVKSNFNKNQRFIVYIRISQIFSINFTTYFSLFSEILNSFPTLWDMLKIMVIITLDENKTYIFNIALEMVF
jgi:hypothetical protein